VHKVGRPDDHSLLNWINSSCNPSKDEPDHPLEIAPVVHQMVVREQRYLEERRGNPRPRRKVIDELRKVPLYGSKTVLSLYPTNLTNVVFSEMTEGAWQPGLNAKPMIELVATPTVSEAIDQTHWLYAWLPPCLRSASSRNSSGTRSAAESATVA
jgi:hypothetical protein